MAAPTWFVGNQNPSITETILNDDGTAHDLTGQTVKFQMRPVGATALAVNAAATIVSAPAGTVRYDWQAADVAAAGNYLVWWQVTTTAGGKTQDVAEALIEIKPHGTRPTLYVEPEELKQLISMDGTSYADDAVLTACHAASRGVDLITNRRFWLDADANQTRTYTPTMMRLLSIDDLAAFTSLKIDRAGSGSFTETWTLGQDFILEPQNAPKDVPPSPYETVRIRMLSGRWLPISVESSVQVTGQFGWQNIPEEIQTCTAILASKMLRRVREAPFGIVAVGGLETGIAARIAKTDPDVAPILDSYTRNTPWL